MDHSEIRQFAHEHRELFFLRKWLEGAKNWAMPVRSGGLWYAHPEHALVALYDAHSNQLITHGLIEGDHWIPSPHRLPGPMALKLYLHRTPCGAPAHIDRDHLRPGIVLVDGQLKPGPNSLLTKLGCALWIRGESQSTGLYGELGIRGRSGKTGFYPFWALWYIESDHGAHLLGPAPDTDLDQCWSIAIPPIDLLKTSRRLVSEMLGIDPWQGPRRFSTSAPWRGELLLVRLGHGPDLTPCLVVSPRAINSRNDLVVIQLLPYHPNDDDPNSDVRKVAYVLPELPQCPGTRWTIFPWMVRGIAIADLYCMHFNPRTDLHEIDPEALAWTYTALRDFYG